MSQEKINLGETTINPGKQEHSPAESEKENPDEEMSRGEAILAQKKLKEMNRIQAMAILNKEFKSEEEREKYAKENLDDEVYEIFKQMRSKKAQEVSREITKEILETEKNINGDIEQHGVDRGIAELMKKVLQKKFVEITLNSKLHRATVNEIALLLAKKYKDQDLFSKQEEIENFITKIATDYVGRFKKST